jgi:hypothetical protein
MRERCRGEKRECGVGKERRSGRCCKSVAIRCAECVERPAPKAAPVLPPLAPSCPLLAPFCPPLHSIPVPRCLAYRAPAALWPAFPVLCMAFRRNLLSVSGLRRPGQGERNGRQAGGGGGPGIRNDGSGD